VDLLAYLADRVLAPIALQPCQGTLSFQLALEFSGGHEDMEQKSCRGFHSSVSMPCGDKADSVGLKLSQRSLAME